MNWSKGMSKPTKYKKKDGLSNHAIVRLHHILDYFLRELGADERLIKKLNSLDEEKERI